MLSALCSLCSLLSALCSLLSALPCSLSALCFFLCSLSLSLLSALCSLLSVSLCSLSLLSLLSALCSLLSLLCSLLSALCSLLSALSQSMIRSVMSDNHRPYKQANKNLTLTLSLKNLTMFLSPPMGKSCPEKQLSLSCLTLSLQLHHQCRTGWRIWHRFWSITGNTLPEQTYLDNYPEDEGKHALLGVHSDSRYVLINRPTFAQTASLAYGYYPAIKTTVSSADMILRLKEVNNNMGCMGIWLHTIRWPNIQTIRLWYRANPYETFTTINFFVPFGVPILQDLDPVNGATHRGYARRASIVKRLEVWYHFQSIDIVTPDDHSLA